MADLKPVYHACRATPISHHFPQFAANVPLQISRGIQSTLANPLFYRRIWFLRCQMD